MPIPVDPELVVFAEQHRHLLPEGFMEEIDALESQLVQNVPIRPTRVKGQMDASTPSNSELRAAVLKELSLFLCSDDTRYTDLRGTGRKLSKDAVHFIAGVIVGTLGIASGMATACVAFVALACLRVGVATFCRLNPPPRKLRGVDPTAGRRPGCAGKKKRS